MQKTAQFFDLLKKNGLEEEEILQYPQPATAEC